MKCNEVKLFLSSYQDSELDAKTKAGVRTHLEKCENCRLEYRELETVRLSIKRLREVEPAQNFTSLVMSKVKERERRRRFALPSLVYSFVFTIVFVLSFLIFANLKNGTAVKQEEVYISNLLIESQDLSLINIQDQTFAMLYNGSKKHGK